jgi:hypothetical protein
MVSTNPTEHLKKLLMCQGALRAGDARTALSAIKE